MPSHHIYMTIKHHISTVVLTAIMWLLIIPCSFAQKVNPYRYDSPNYWMMQSEIDLNAGKFDIAREDLKKAEKGYSDLGDVEHQTMALRMLAEINIMLGEWEEAKEHNIKALQIAIDNKNELAQTNIIISLLKLFHITDDREAYNKYKLKLDSVSFHTKSTQIKVISYYYYITEFMTHQELDAAESMLQELWKILPELSILERENSKRNYYQYMAAIKVLQRKNWEAIDYQKKYIEKIKDIEGEKSDNQYQAYSDLGLLYAQEQLYSNTFSCMDSVELGIGKPYQGEELTTTFYNTKGTCYFLFKDYETALYYFDKAYNTITDKKSEESPAKFMSLAKKAQTLVQLKRIKEALKTYEEIAEVAKKKFGVNSNQYQFGLTQIADIEGHEGNKERAESLFRDAMSILLYNMRQTWMYSMPSQRETLWEEALKHFTTTAGFATKYGFNNSELTEVCYNALMFSKALLLENEKSFVDILRKEGTPENIADYKELVSINNKLQSLKSNYEHNILAIDSLNRNIRKLEQRLNAKCKSYKEYEWYVNIDYKTVRNALKEGEVVLDFTNYMKEDSAQQYDAYIFNRTMEHPVLVSCFRQQQIDSLLNGEQSHMLYSQEMHQDDATKLLWGTIKQHIPEGSTVYYIPSGIIHTIALEALPLSDGSTLGQHYNFIRLTSPRELLRVQQQKQQNKTARLYGGLKYTLTDEQMNEESEKYNETISWAFITRSARGDEGLNDLKKSKEEVVKIAKTLRDNGFSVETLSGAKGNAESFIALSGKAPTIIHLATHGFYFTPDEAKEKSFFKDYADDMSRSGLVFSGGNADWLGIRRKGHSLGGILTAKDISYIDLEGVDMVVLSACKTAQGKVTPEGVYGLQRAFKKAGVRTIVMSLWSINDDATSKFMTTFYEQLAAPENNWDKRKAFEKTKEIIRKRYHDPYYWAAFVMLD